MSRFRFRIISDGGAKTTTSKELTGSCTIKIELIFF
jgi:hypothetical protein